ncbi:MAG: SM-20-related protein [Halioglobus sp.]
MESPLIRVRLLLEGGHCQDIELRPDAPELTSLFQVLGSRAKDSLPSQEQFFQLPVRGGTESFSFNSAQLVALSTQPPVVVEFEHCPLPTPAPEIRTQAVQLQRPEYMVIDNFLGHYEHLDMLAYAVQHKEGFDAGTVATGPQNARENLVILDFAQQAHSTLLCNRLLTWFPQILHTLGMDPFPVQQVESQLTANNDGHYYRAHLDTDENSELARALTCVYYFSKQPAQFTGGALRIYDSLTNEEQRWQAESFQQVEPVSNRMVVFPSDSYHELLPIRCPSRQFEDSRFSVTNWIWRAQKPDAQASHGWGHMHCAKLPANASPKEGLPS